MSGVARGTVVNNVQNDDAATVEVELRRQRLWDFSECYAQIPATCLFVRGHDERRLNNIIAKCTGKPVEQVAQETERDHYLSAEEALEYGIVDEILDEARMKKEKKESKSK